MRLQPLAPLETAPAKPGNVHPRTGVAGGPPRHRSGAPTSHSQPVDPGPAFRLARKGLPHGRSRQSSEGPQRSGGLAKRVDGRDRPCVVNAFRAKRGPYPVSLRIGLNPPTHVSGEPENDVVAIVERFLREAGWTIVQRSNTTQTGPDLEAVQRAPARRLYVEAKGATSARQGSRRHGRPFDRSQVKDHVANAFYTAAKVSHEHLSAIAVPRTHLHEAFVDAIGDALVTLKISVLWVGDDKVVTTWNWQDDRGVRANVSRPIGRLEEPDPANDSATPPTAGNEPQLGSKTGEPEKKMTEQQLQDKLRAFRQLPRRTRDIGRDLWVFEWMAPLGSPCSSRVSRYVRERGRLTAGEDSDGLRRCTLSIARATYRDRTDDQCDAGVGTPTQVHHPRLNPGEQHHLTFGSGDNATSPSGYAPSASSSGTVPTSTTANPAGTNRPTRSGAPGAACQPASGIDRHGRRGYPALRPRP